MLFHKYQTWRKQKNIEKGYLEDRPISEEEQQSKLIKYDTPLSDYMDIVIIYGYAIIFGSNFVFTSFLFLLLIIIQIRVDAWKLCNINQRPFPEPANSIGAWHNIIQVISIFGAITILEY